VLRYSGKALHLQEVSGSFAAKNYIMQRRIGRSQMRFIAGRNTNFFSLAASGWRGYGLITTSWGPAGSANLTPRSWFSLRVAGRSKSAIWIFFVQEPLVQ
jgi:hypothetical protein